MTHFHAGRRAVVAALLASFAATGAFAQAKYPDHPITFVVPFAAGSATDQLARALGASITADTKQAVRRLRQRGRWRRHGRRRRLP